MPKTLALGTKNKGLLQTTANTDS